MLFRSVVGAGPPLAVGAAFAQQYTGSGAITVCFFGDGAAAEGSVHEAMNLAALWKVPVLFICENNCWAGAQALGEHCPVGEIACRATGYGMPGEAADGNDVRAMHEATARLAAQVRAGEGPALLEAHTYRMLGHGTHDPQHYVDKDELAAWAGKDPIARWRAELLRDGTADEAALDALDAAAGKAVEEAVAFADASPYPAPEAALDHVFVDPPAVGASGGAT